MASTAVLRVQYDDDIRSFYGLLIDQAPITLSIKSVKPSLLASARAASLVWIDKGGAMEVSVRFSKETEQGFVFDTLGEPAASPANEHNRVDYKGNFDAKIIKEEQVPEFRRTAERINSQNRTSLASKVRATLQNETPQMQNILYFLLELNSKMDSILEHIAPEEKESGMSAVRCIDISGSGFRFFLKKALPEKTNLYVHGKISDPLNQFTFAAVCTISQVIPTSAGAIHEASFSYLDEDMRDEIIRFVFSKERVLLKGIKS